jgi:hypothetical protein
MGDAKRDHSRHQSLVAAMVALGFETRGFRRKLASALVGHDCTRKCVCEFNDCVPCYWRGVHEEIVATFPRVVDAFRFHTEDRRVEIVEVVVTHDLKRDKIVHIHDLGAFLDDSHEWLLEVTHLDICLRPDTEPWFEVGTNARLHRLAMEINEARANG